MAVVKGSVIGYLSGKLGHLSARTLKIGRFSLRTSMLFGYSVYRKLLLLMLKENIFMAIELGYLQNRDCL